jgi:hypothetical protein
MVLKAGSIATPADGTPVPFSATAETMICFSQPGEFARAKCGWLLRMTPAASNPLARTKLRMNEARVMALGIAPNTRDHMAIPQAISPPGTW